MSTPISQLPVDLRPREKAIKYGFKQLSDEEVLAIIIRSGTRNSNAMAISRTLIHASQGLDRINQFSLSQLVDFEGINTIKAIELLAVFELQRRMLEPKLRDDIDLSYASHIYDWLRMSIGNLKQEHFIALYLNKRNQLQTYRILFIGTLDSALVHPREVFKGAFETSASSIVLVHNHPGGTLYPSVADCTLTKRLVEAGQLIGISVVDHILITNSGYFSIRESHEFLFED